MCDCRVINAYLLTYLLNRHPKLSNSVK